MTPEERAKWLEPQDVILEQESGVTLDQMVACLMAIRDKAGHGDMLCINLAAGYSEETIPVSSVFLNAGDTISID
jgi:hypothetical protein